jgi:cobalt-zinc-cadmium efflux system outer membrane protein
LRIFIFVFLLSTTRCAFSQQELTAEEAVRRAVAASPAVKAALSRLEAAEAALRAARAPFGVTAEAAPGIGFTNGNAALSHRIDIGGRRRAASAAAEGELLAARAALDSARLQEAADTRAAYFDLVRARAVESAAREMARIVEQLRNLVRRRVEIGESPLIQATRADIESTRAEQGMLRAAGESRGLEAELNVRLGNPPDTPVRVSDAFPPTELRSPAQLTAEALRRRPEIAEAQGRIAARRGEAAVARAQGRPDLFAEFAADVWSVDRRESWNSRNLGLQARVSFPLLDFGANPANVRRAEALTRSEESELAALQRKIAIEVERAYAGTRAANTIVENYQRTILPKTEELLRATRAGFETGLSSFLEVVEAQRAARQTQEEYQSALFAAIRNRVELERATATVPGLPESTIRR